MSVTFRNVDASPTDDVSTWPYEALVTTLERGFVADWRPVFEAIRREPWGAVARRVQHYASYSTEPAVAALVSRVIAAARERQDRRDRDEVARRVRLAIDRSGLTAARFADAVGTSASRLSTYASGRVTPSAALMLRIERVGADRLASVPSLRGEQSAHG